MNISASKAPEKLTDKELCKQVIRDLRRGGFRLTPAVSEFQKRVPHYYIDLSETYHKLAERFGVVGKNPGGQIRYLIIKARVDLDTANVA